MSGLKSVAFAKNVQAALSKVGSQASGQGGRSRAQAQADTAKTLSRSAATPEDEDDFVPHPALLEHLTQRYNMVFGVKRQVRTDDNPTLARAQKDLWHIWEAPVRLEFKKH